MLSWGVDKTPFGALLSIQTSNSVSFRSLRDDPNALRAVKGGSVRDVYSAIADPTRREMIALLAETDEAPLHEITPRFDMGRTAVSKHLSVLKQAGLVAERKVGRETRHRLTPEPLQEVQQWVNHYEMFWTARLDQLKALLEGEQNE